MKINFQDYHPYFIEWHSFETMLERLRRCMNVKLES